MKRKRSTEEQIIDVLRENEAGGKTEDICRRHGVSTAILRSWRKKYGGIDASEGKRLRDLESECPVSPPCRGTLVRDNVHFA